MFDAIVVGARCGGSPTAMLLARRGYRVLLVDRATFPSDTISTHFIWPPGVACLKRWGLLDRLSSTNCPATCAVGLDLGAFHLSGCPPAMNGVAEMYAPRRTVLDKLLLDAASEAGAEIREGFSVTGLASDNGRVTGVHGRGRRGAAVEEQARIVIGADGRNSLVAKTVGATEYKVRDVLTCCYYTYWADVPPHPTTMWLRPRRFLASFRTNCELMVTVFIFPHDEFETVRSSLEQHCWEALKIAPELAELIRAGRRAERIMGMGNIRNFFRKPYGDGWALVGDAGYHKDTLTAQGITDAFRSAELLTEAIHHGFSGAQPMKEAMAEYQRLRDERGGPMYELTCSLASLEPPPPEMLALYQALRSNQPETDRFFGTLAGTVPIAEYYAPENLRRIVGGAAAGA
jgi:flavin-dependent dehydrogenase